MSGHGLKFALLLHPAAYRRERGEELASVFADTTAGMGRWTTAREVIDLAGHGVRLRIGLGSDGLPSQLAALAAPFAATAAVAGGLASQVVDLARWHQLGVPSKVLWAEYGSFHVFLLGQGGLLLSLVAAIAAVFGRWTTARLSGLVGLLLTLTNTMIMLTYSPSWAEGQWALLIARAVVWYGPQALWVLILLAAPRDLLGPATRRRTWSALAGALMGGFALNTALGLGPVRSLNNGAGSVVLALVLGATELALLAVAVPALLRGRYGPAAAALAGSPIAFLMFSTAVSHLWKSGGHGTAVALFGIAAVIAVALSRRRPTIPDRQPPEAG
ncbi:hypothetical protein GCM10010193_67670 [Kitasatospora atroaurantiaca]|uniref:Uncharacterized protein n=1 Tax=Kitasatospora atroaurantiaca TaxID=285545 RepID=A0A561EHV7_9ACTN|nr:hypothetical protein [Kitasatospora atroaurantiaca]TWE15191.1 hypothetical protein FB465_0067 [Kitasatospora atroaurantiaca]